MSRARWIGLAALVGMSLAVRAAGGEERRAVDLVIAGSAERVRRVEEALDEPLGRLPVELRLERAAAVDPKVVVDPAGPRHGAFARIWVDVGAERRATLYFVDAAWERILVRHVPLEQGLDEVEREEIAQIVRAAVEALLGGATIGISREQARAELLPESERQSSPPVATAPRRAAPRDAPRPAPRRPAAAAPEVVVDIGALYEAQSYADEPWHGPGLFVQASGSGPLELGGRFSAQYRAPVRIDGEALGVRLSAAALRALAIGAVEGDGVALGFGVGGGADVTRVEPARVAPGAEPAPATWDVVPVVRAQGGAGLRWPGVSAWLQLGVDFEPIETRHVAERDGERYTVFAAPRARPFVSLEVSTEVPRRKQ